ncbi:hypothetical protein QJQ45_008367 [Haematococcus lacustris]|nr:hypothetical protein QJQ45_008367 [Haematococcus lacustris]
MAKEKQKGSGKEKKGPPKKPKAQPASMEWDCDSDSESDCDSEPEPQSDSESESEPEPVTQPPQCAAAPLKEFSKFYANPNFLTVYNQLQRRLVRPRQRRHPMLMPVFEDPSNQALLAKLQELGNIDLKGDTNTIGAHSMQLTVAMQQHYSGLHIVLHKGCSKELLCFNKELQIAGVLEKATSRLNAYCVMAKKKRKGSDKHKKGSSKKLKASRSPQGKQGQECRDGWNTRTRQPSSSSANKTINTIQQLTEHEELLERKKILLEKRAEAELQRAREFTQQKKKPQALQCLKKKKLIENEIANMDNMIMRVIEQRSMLENQRTTVEVVSTMHQGTQAMKDNMKAMKIDKVDKVLDEINETADQMRQINDVFANPIGSAVDLDEDELNAELAELEETQLDTELLQPAPVPTTRVPAAAAAASTAATAKMPTVPARKAAPAKTQEELELEQLQAEMAL